jgi:hypothetical protein
MSALGQKRTFAVQEGMSVLPPKADIRKMCAPLGYIKTSAANFAKHIGSIGGRSACGGH